MKWKRMLLTTIATMALAASHVSAQSNQTTPEERPAMASYWGDTGLWFLPTAEVVRPGGWSFSLYRTEFDFKQGRTDVEDWPVTLAAGVGPRLELFGALRAVTRIDRDTRPLFQPGPGEQEVSGVVNDRPFVHDPWTGGHLGDLRKDARLDTTRLDHDHPDHGERDEGHQEPESGSQPAMQRAAPPAGRCGCHQSARGLPTPVQG